MRNYLNRIKAKGLKLYSNCHTSMRIWVQNPSTNNNKNLQMQMQRNNCVNAGGWGFLEGPEYKHPDSSGVVADSFVGLWWTSEQGFSDWGRVISEPTTDNLESPYFPPSLHSQMCPLLSPTGLWIWAELTGVAGCSPGCGGFGWVCPDGWCPSSLCFFMSGIVSCWLNVPLIPEGLHILQYIYLRKVWCFDMHFG
jgi:hypothetical protein